MSLDTEIETTVTTLDALTLSSLHDPTLEFFYQKYIQRGILYSTADILTRIEPVSREPILHTLGSHVTKEKPLFIYAIACSKGLDPDTSRTLASSIDLLWSLSLMYDDIEDGDQFRAGKPSSWVKYGVNQTSVSMQKGLEQVLKALSGKFGDDIIEKGKDSIQIAIKSLAEHRTLTFLDPKEKFYHCYYSRQSFHTLFPMVAIWQNSPEIEESEALEALQNVNLAGQLTNDIKDMLPSYSWIRPGFSDLRGGLITLPLKVMWEELSSQKKYQLSQLLGIKSYDDDQKQFLLDCMVDSKASQIMIDKIRLIYSRAKRNFNKVISNPDDQDIVFQWINYKEKQVENFI